MKKFMSVMVLVAALCYCVAFTVALTAASGNAAKAAPKVAEGRSAPESFAAMRYVRLGNTAVDPTGDKADITKSGP